MDRDRLLRAVDERFATTGAGTAPWPDPHPDRSVGPPEEEYSRCLDPGRYRIVGARLQAWTEVLTGLRLAEVHAEPELDARFRQTLLRPPGRALRVVPLRPGALPVLAHLEIMSGVPDAVTALATEEPFLLLTALPDCGCDACDSGSADLLEELDEWLLGLVGGDFVHLLTEHGTITSRDRDSWQAGADLPRDVDVGAALRAARAGTGRYRAVRGLPWSG